MSKPISAAALALIQQPTGTEPFFVVEINWGLGSSFYSTRKFKDYNPNVIEIGPIRNERTADSMCNVGSVKVKFSDTDGLIKFVIDNRVAENAPAIIHMAYPSMEYADFVPLLIGVTTGPIEWDELNRTFELEIETYVKGQQVGYSATRADFSDMNSDAEGIPWPMVFGTCAHVPALHFKKRPLAHLQCSLKLYEKPVYVKTTTDFTLIRNPAAYAFIDDDPEINVLYVDDASDFPSGTIGLIINDVVFYGSFSDNHQFNITATNEPKFSDLSVGPRGADADTSNYHVLWLDDSNSVSIAGHHCYFKTTSGTEWYNQCVRQEGNKCWFRFQFINPDKPFNLILMDESKVIESTYAITVCGMVSNIAADIIKLKYAARSKVGGVAFGLMAQHLDSLADKASSWWTADMDSEVRLWDPYPSDIYVASLIPLTDVIAVYGHRRIEVEGKTRTILAPIPESYYDVIQGNYTVTNGLRPTALVFDTPLCEYQDQNWEDDVFVSCTSSIGPNSVDIIRYLYNVFSTIPVDPVSFPDVRDRVNGAPANFALFDKRDIIRLTQEIAFQAKCSLLFDRGMVGLSYIPHQNPITAIYNDSNTKNLNLTFTQTKEVKTRLVTSFAPTYQDSHHLTHSRELNIASLERVVKSFLPAQARSRSETQYVTYTNNINKFGLHTREEAAYIFNEVSYVDSFALFWGFRFSNVWRIVSFETWTEGVVLQPFDIIELNYSDINLLHGTIPCVVESAEFNPQTKITKVLVTLPIQAGLTASDPNFWPE